MENIKNTLGMAISLDKKDTFEEYYVSRVFSQQGWLDGYIELSGNGVKSYLSLSSSSNPAK